MGTPGPPGRPATAQMPILEELCSPRRSAAGRGGCDPISQPSTDTWAPQAPNQTPTSVHMAPTSVNIRPPAALLTAAPHLQPVVRAICAAHEPPPRSRTRPPTPALPSPTPHHRVHTAHVTSPDGTRRPPSRPSFHLLQPHVVSVGASSHAWPLGTWKVAQLRRALSVTNTPDFKQYQQLSVRYLVHSFILTVYYCVMC